MLVGKKSGITYSCDYTIQSRIYNKQPGLIPKLYECGRNGGGGGGGNIILIIILFTFGFRKNAVKNIHYYNIYKFALSYSLFKAKISYYSLLIRPKPEQNPSSGFAE